jgi:hypothetical protein
MILNTVVEVFDGLLLCWCVFAIRRHLTANGFKTELADKRIYFMAVAFIMHSCGSALAFVSLHSYVTSVRQGDASPEAAKQLLVIWTICDVMIGVVEALLLVFILSRIAGNKAMIRFSTTLITTDMSQKSVEDDFQKAVQVDESDVL